MTTLSDNDILQEMAAGRLVRNGANAQVAGAVYELRTGDVYYDLTESDRPIPVPAGGTILIKPGHRVVLLLRKSWTFPATS